jgi:3-carboxy-cis,cis-muconate cycloisomerase
MGHMFDLVTADPQHAFSERALVAAMLRQEAAVAQAQASLGLMAAHDAQSIISTCKVDLFDVPQIIRDSMLTPFTSNGEPPIIKSLRDSVRLFNPQAAAAVYRLGQPQDLLDNALALLTQDVLALLHTDVMARSQHPEAAHLLQSWRRVELAASHALCVRLSARQDDTAVPTPALQHEVGKTLGLAVAEAPQRETWMSLGAELGVLALCAQRWVASRGGASLTPSRTPLWVAQWLTELSHDTRAGEVGRDFWRVEFPLWSTLVIHAIQSVRQIPLK